MILESLPIVLPDVATVNMYIAFLSTVSKHAFTPVKTARRILNFFDRMLLETSGF
jgi:hypothetical protein